MLARLIMSCVISLCVSGQNGIIEQISQQKDLNHYQRVLEIGNLFPGVSITCSLGMGCSSQQFWVSTGKLEAMTVNLCGAVICELIWVCEQVVALMWRRATAGCRWRVN